MEQERLSLTHDQIVGVVGEIGDERIMAIINTGATLEELEEAAAWASGESDVMGKMHMRLTGAAAQVFEILTAGEEFEEEAQSH